MDDSDWDGLNNGEEIGWGTDPLNPDTDGDNLDDGEEVTLGADGFLTDPLNVDSDFDWINDDVDPDPNDWMVGGPSQVVALDPVDVYMGDTLRITYETRDWMGNRCGYDDISRFTATVTGSAVFTGDVIEGSLISGAGTNQAAVRVAGGRVTLLVTDDSTPETVRFSAFDSHGIGFFFPGDVFFFDNMEFGVNGWATQLLNGTIDDLWHQTEENADSPTHSWRLGIDAQNSYSTGWRISNALVSPWIFISGPSAEIRFSEWFSVEEGYDLCQVEVSTDGVNYFPVRNPYFLPGNSGGFVNRVYDMTAFAGNWSGLIVRFFFDTGDEVNNNYAGWFMDDFSIVAAGEQEAAFMADPAQDDDGDGVNNAAELAAGTDPINPDTDGDGRSDGDEVNGGGGIFTDPLTPDSDGDFLFDGEEIISGIDGFITDPNNPDSDGDTIIDSEDDAPNDPAVSSDSDGDGKDDSVDNCPSVPNHLQENDDGDSAGNACDFCPDDFGDAVDIDGDGLCPDLDDDGDGLSDADELIAGTDPENPDTDGGGMPDGDDTDPLDPNMGDPAQLQVVDPSDVLQGETMTVTYEVLDASDSLLTEDSITIFTIRVSGSAVFANTASAGTILSGGGTSEAQVQAQGGVVTIDLTDPVSEDIYIYPVDSEGLGLDLVKSYLDIGQFFSGTQDLADPNTFTFNGLPDAIFEDVTLTASVRGDFGELVEYLTVYGEAIGESDLGYLFYTGGQECPATPQSQALIMAMDEFNSFNADRVVTLVTDLTADVNYTQCATNTVSLTLSYRAGVNARFNLDPLGDEDGDKILNSVEETTGTDPFNPDTDGDGLWDGDTLGVGEDLDHDGVVDPGESDPLNPDTDNDRMDDGLDVDPLNPLIGGRELVEVIQPADVTLGQPMLVTYVVHDASGNTVDNDDLTRFTVIHSSGSAHFAPSAQVGTILSWSPTQVEARVSGGIFSIQVTNTMAESVTFDAVDSENNGLIYPSTPLFSDDIESGASGWSTDLQLGTIDDLWHITNSYWNSPTQSWWCGIEFSNDYNTWLRIANGLLTPWVDLSVPHPVLAFRENYSTEPVEDVVRVEATTDEVIFSPLRSDQSGTSGGTVFSILDLSAFQGQDIRIRFTLESSDAAGNAFMGWWIDDVVIRNDQVKSANFTP